MDGSLLSMNYNGTEYFYITDMFGSIIEMVDISGITVVKYSYDAWGNIVDQFDSGVGIDDINPFRYRGYYLDSETGLYYLQSRYYDPEIGRFISSDGLVGSLGDIKTHNMYSYCGNNPVMYTDSDGEFPILILIIVAVYIAWGIQDICDIANGEIGVEETESGIKIVDSYKVQNPSVVIGYSIYLRYFSEHKESFDGSAAGIASEWIWHNVGYDVTVIPSKFGFLQDYNDRAASADIGSTIFNESNWYVKYPSVVIETVLNPVAVIYDYSQYIHQSAGDSND